MKIKNQTIGISVLHIAVSLFVFAVFSLSAYTSQTLSLIVWGIAFALLMLLIPIYNSYNLSLQYTKLLPEYESESKLIKIRAITLAQNGKPVRIRGTIEGIKGTLICRPGFLINDRSAQIWAQRSVPLDEKFEVGDYVEVVGMVVKRYNLVGKVVVHAIGVKKALPESENSEPQSKTKSKSHK